MILIMIQQIVAFALHNVCLYPEYLKPLREEAANPKRHTDGSIDYDQMPLMDSFLKETARLNPTTICRLQLPQNWI